MSTPTTAVLDIDKLDVEDGVNPRTRFDETRLAELEASIGQDGLVTALTVVPGDGDRFTVIAGERRLIAARRAGLTQAPVLIRAVKGSRAATLVENLIREDLDPIDAAQGLADLAEAENLTTHQQIATRIGKKSASWVSQHLRLLKLPEAVQTYIAAGEVPVEGERPLRGIAKVSPRIAECVCELARREKVSGGEFVERFDELLSATAVARFEDPPTMIDPGAAQLSAIVADEKKRRELGERHLAARPHTHTDNPVLRFDEAELDAARAAGCLLEHKVDHGDWHSTVAFITDVEFAADLAERAVARVESEAAERKKKEEEWRAAGDGREPALTPEAQKQQRRAQLEERKERAEQARRSNEELGAALLKRRGGASRKQHALARAKAVAAIVLADNPNLAARGLRLVSDRLQDVEVKQLKTSGERREKVSYADPQQCADYLAKRIEGARSVGEVLELLGDAVIALLLADQAALPQSKRVGAGIGARREVEALLTADIKSVRPRRRRRTAKK